MRISEVERYSTTSQSNSFAKGLIARVLRKANFDRLALFFVVGKPCFRLPWLHIHGWKSVSMLKADGTIRKGRHPLESFDHMDVAKEFQPTDGV